MQENNEAFLCLAAGEHLRGRHRVILWFETVKIQLDKKLQHHLPPIHPTPPKHLSPQTFVLLNPQLRLPLTYFISVSVLAMMIHTPSTVILLNNALDEGTQLFWELNRVKFNLTIDASPH